LASFSPQGGYFPEYAIFTFKVLLTTPLTDYIKTAQSIPVSEYIGIKDSGFFMGEHEGQGR
jgi:hypothetical protein